MFDVRATDKSEGLLQQISEIEYEYQALIGEDYLDSDSSKYTAQDDAETQKYHVTMLTSCIRQRHRPTT